MLLIPGIQVLVRHIKTECRSDSTHLGMPIVHRFVIGQRISLKRKDAKMLLDTLDRRAEANSMGMMMQVCAATVQVRIGKIRDNDITSIETCAFGRANHIVANDRIAEGKHLVHIRLRTGVHIQNTGSIREQLRQEFLQRLDYFGYRTIF